MQRDDIERMAREAKCHPYTNRYTPGETAFAFSIDRLKHFVSLVTAAEQDRCCKIVYGMAGSDNVAQRTVDAIKGKE